MAIILCAELVLPTLTLDTVQSYPTSNFHPSTVGHIHLVFTMLPQDDEKRKLSVPNIIPRCFFLCWMIRYFVSNPTHPGKTWKYIVDKKQFKGTMPNVSFFCCFALSIPALVAMSRCAGRCAKPNMKAVGKCVHPIFFFRGNSQRCPPVN